MNKFFQKRFAWTLSAMTLANVLVLPASQVAFAQDEELPKFESSLTNEGKPIEGGTIKYALVGDPFKGVLNSMLYDGSPDGSIIGFFNEGLYGYDENFGVDDSGFAKIEFNQEEKTVKITIPEGVKWDDGEPLTIDDVIFPYLVIGSPDYTGIRYGSDYENVQGMAEYHAGEADSISGLERVDDYTLVVHYINFPNSMLQAGGGVASFIEPSHYLKDIPIKDLENAPEVREKPVGFGPFKVESIVPGESVKFVANEYYWRGKPSVDGLQLDVVNPTSIVAELKAGNYDIASLPADQYDTYKDATNFKILGVLENSYQYIGFKLGTWDAEAEEVKMDETKVVSNKALRQAMAYAIDTQAINKEFYKGLRPAANSMITPNFTSEFYNKDQEGYSYDPEKAKQILADAGFKDTNGDGFVEDPNGKEFKLGFASMSGGETAEPIAQYFLQSWKEVGINVELVDGRLLEFNTFYDRIKKDDPAIDVYAGAWGVGGDPNPNGLYGRKAPFNYTRFASEEHDKLLEAIDSDQSFDKDFRQKAFYDWQAYMHEEAPTIPILYRNGLTAVNNRISTYDVTIGSDLDWSKIQLLADEPVAE